MKKNKIILLVIIVLILFSSLFFLSVQKKKIRIVPEKKENKEETEKEKEKVISRIERIFQPIDKIEDEQSSEGENFYQKIFLSEGEKKPEDFNNNYTQYLGYQIFQNLKKSASPQEFLSQEKISENVQKEISRIEEEFDLNKKKFKLEDLKIVLKKSTSTVKKFDQDFVKIAQESGLTKNPPSLALEKFAQDKDASALEKTINSIDKFLEKATTIDVPLGYQEIYLEYLNTLSLSNEIYRAIVNYKKDPLKAIVALNSLEKIGKKIEAIALLFKEKFSEDLGENF